ncbi:hypothetical protein BDV39DRAFT_204335 [Aspergillus sergii]|uniref:NACHT domain-containing protein n=1 Tax=Aspergillus sergii TaxID=1034303 RepID=A0A5N6X5K3_9EURO|nr:hypothetical protein BDV39DRAFT_204335 [Aspergillus sergii]
MFRKLAGCLGCGKDHSDHGDDNGPPSQPVNPNGELMKEKEEASKAELPARIQVKRSLLSAPSLPDPASTSQLSLREVESEPKTQNLWVLAHKRLSPEDQICFEVGEQNTMEKIIEEVLDKIEARGKEYKEGGLQIRDLHGKSINVQECFQGIIKSVSQVQDLVKNVASFDPTGHASQAWAIVSVGLTLIKNDIERRDDVIEASGFLANTLSYYAIIDKNDRNRQVDSDEHIEEALVKVYTAILEYTAEVYRASRENRADRARKSVSALVDQPLKRLKDAIELERKNVKEWTELGRNEDQQKLNPRVLNSLDLEILDWLSPTDQSGREQSAIYSKAKNDRTSQTGDWFLDSLGYQKWKAEPGSIMWLHGVVGCGKTVLCSTIIADVRQGCECDPTKKLAYWYFDFNQNKEQVVDNMLRSVMRQLCPHPVPESIVKLWEEHRLGREPTRTDLYSTFEQMIESFTGRVILIFDALDECPEIPENPARGTLLKFLNKLITRHKQTLHILATSRPEYDICRHLENHTPIDIEKYLSQDVERFVNDRLETGKLAEWLNENQPMKEKIRKKLLDIESPRFRWADLQINSLERCQTPTAINKTLETLPKDLSETYGKILNDMSEDNRDAARTILIWVTFSRGQLTLEFLAKLVNFIRPQGVIDVCTTDLITISDNFVRLAHFSVKEFLVPVDISGKPDWYQFSASTGHFTIANESLSLLLQTDDNLTRDAAFDQPVLVYAANQLGFHLSELEQIGFWPPELHESIAHLFDSSVAYLNWVRIANGYRGFSNDWYLSADNLEPPIFRASKMGLVRVVESLLKNGADPLAPFYRTLSNKENLLAVAAKYGHLDVLELLVQTSTVIPKTLVCSTIKSICCGQERERVRKILASLHEKASFYYDPEHSNTIDKHIIAAAAANGWSGDVLIQILLDWPNRGPIYITRGVMNAVLHNDDSGERIMQLLLRDQGTHIYITRNGINHMIEEGRFNPNVVKIVIEMRGHEIQFNDWTMKRIVGYDSTELLEFLLSSRDDVSITTEMLEVAARSWKGSGPLHLLLKKRESTINITMEMLVAAADNYSDGFEMMKLLLEEWSPDTPIGEEVIYELACNSYYGLEIMNLFLQRQQTGITISQEVLARAAKFNNREMLEVLVNYVNNTESGIKVTPEVLCAAADNWKSAEAVMTYLLDLGGKDLEISESVLVSAAGNKDGGANVLSLVLDRFPEARVTDRVFEAACESQDSMAVLLKRFPNQFPKEIVIEKIATDTISRYPALELLIHQGVIDIDQNLVEKLARNYNALKTLFKFKPDFPVSHQTLRVAAEKSTFCMDIVLCACKMECTITADIVDAALKSTGIDETYKLCDFAVIRLLFGQYGSRFPITEMVLTRAALHKNPYGALDFLLGKEPGVDLQRVWETVWQNDYSEVDKLGASKVLLKRAGLEVTESIMESTVSRSIDDKDDFDDLIQFSIKEKIPMPESERAMWIVIERFHYWQTVESFLEYKPNIKITLEQFYALAGYESIPESLIKTLLGRKDF